MESVITCKTRMYSLERERVLRRVRAALHRGVGVTLEITLSNPPRNAGPAMKALGSVRRALGDEAIVVQLPMVVGDRVSMKLVPRATTDARVYANLESLTPVLEPAERRWTSSSRRWLRGSSAYVPIARTPAD